MSVTSNDLLELVQ